MTTLNDVLEILENNNKHLIPRMDYGFMADYYNNAQKFDSLVTFLFGSRIFNEKPIDDVDVITLWESLVVGYLNTNKHNLDFLYDGLKAEYNPLNNYDKSSTITTTMGGKEINTNTPSGTETETTTIGSGTSTMTTQISPNENNEFYNSGKNISENEEQTNTIQTSFDNRTTTDTKEFDHRTDTVIEKTTGNIGVTTSTQMLNEEYTLRMRSFLLELLEKMIKTITY